MRGSVHYAADRRRWICEVRGVNLPGFKRRYYKSFQTEREARVYQSSVNRLLDEVEDRQSMGLPVAEVAEAVASCPTFKGFSDEWISWMRKMNRAQSTIDGYQAHLRLHLLPRFGGLRLDRITTKRVDEMVGELAESHAGNGVRRIHGTLSSCLGRAVRRGLLRSNPCGRVELPTVRADEEAEARTEITEKQLAALLGACNERYAFLFTVAARTGLRLSECGRLRWNDLSAGIPGWWQTILDTVGAFHGWPSGVYATALVRRSKARKQRVVAVSPEAWEALCEAPRSVDGRVFPSLRMEERTANVTKSSAGVVRRYLERACNRAEIPRITLHDLRHHWATTLGIAGTPPEMLRSWGGWRDLSMVERYCRAPAVEVGAGGGLCGEEGRASNAPAASGDDETSETARARKPA